MCLLIHIKRKRQGARGLTPVKLTRRKSGTVTPMRHERRLIEAVLGNLRLLWGATPSQRADLAAQCWTLALARGQSLAHAGERLPGVLAVAYGAVKLRIVANGAGERVLRVAGAGESFGESAALLGKASFYEPVALGGTKLIVIPAAALLSLIERDPRLARGMLIALAERKYGLLRGLQANAPWRGLQRLAAYLESLAEPSDGQDVLTARLPGTKTLLAAQLGMSKETLSRLLRRLAARGTLEVSRREVAILDRAALAALARGERG
jgi:CRP-like cAMP-binding protein